MAADYTRVKIRDGFRYDSIGFSTKIAKLYGPMPVANSQFSDSGRTMKLPHNDIGDTETVIGNR